MYLLFKSVHLIFMVGWFAGLFYMFRLFVYHRENHLNKDIILLLKTMEHRLYYYITTPAMVLCFLCGIGLSYHSSYNLDMPWFKYKVALVSLLICYHHYIGHTLKRFKKDDMFLSSKLCRIINEVPTLFLVSIICTAVYRNTF
jgi:putative membrane protein